MRRLVIGAAMLLMGAVDARSELLGPVETSDAQAAIIKILADAEVLADQCPFLQADTDVLLDLYIEGQIAPSEIRAGGRRQALFRKATAEAMAFIVQTAEDLGVSRVDVACRAADHRYGKRGVTRANLALFKPAPPPKTLAKPRMDASALQPFVRAIALLRRCPGTVIDDAVMASAADRYGYYGMRVRDWAVEEVDAGRVGLLPPESTACVTAQKEFGPWGTVITGLLRSEAWKTLLQDE